MSVNAILFAIWLALLAALALVWLNPPVKVADLSVDGVGVDAPALLSGDAPTLALAPLDEYQEIVERPLFFQARRPPSPEEEDAPEPEPDAPDDELLLIGVMRVGDSTTALIQNQTTGKVLRLRDGDPLDGGWQVEAIGTNTVTLQKGSGASKELELIRNKRKPSPQISQQAERLRQQRLQARQQRLDGGDPDVADGTPSDDGGEPLLDENGRPVDENGEPPDADADADPAAAPGQLSEQQQQQLEQLRQLQQQLRESQLQQRRRAQPGDDAAQGRAPNN